MSGQEVHYGADVIAAARLHDALRIVLVSHFPRVQAAHLAAALSYELCSLVASAADTVEDANAYLDAVRQGQREQLQVNGVGGPHP